MATTQVGGFSAAEALSEGSTVLYQKKGLLVPFFVSSMVGILPLLPSRLLGVLGLGALPLALISIGLQFLGSLMGWLIAAWGTWIIFMRYRGLEMAKGLGAPDLRYSDPWFFLSRRNPLLGSLIRLGIIISGISILGGIPLGSGLGTWTLLISWSGMLLFWLVSVALSYALFGIVTKHLSCTDALALSARIVRNNLLNALGLALGLALIGFILSYLFRFLVFPLLFPVLRSYDPWAMVPSSITGILAGGISVGLSASCLCYAFLSSLGHIDKVRVALVRGKATETCDGNPRIPECLKCRQLQEYGDKYFCTRFSKALKKPGKTTTSDPNG